MAEERIKQNNLCETCISRLIWPLAGRACMGHNHEGTFLGLLKLVAPNNDWDEILAAVKEVKESDRGYRSNE